MTTRSGRVAASSVVRGTDRTPRGEYSVRAVERVCLLLDALQARPEGASLAELAATVALAKPVVFRYLATLVETGYAIRLSDSGHYRPGFRLLARDKRALELLVRVARPFLEQVLRDLQETVNLAALEGERMTYLEILESPRAFRFAARRGDSDLVHCTAVGKAVAATLKEEEVRRIISATGMPSVTGSTITALPALLEELARVREVGYAVDDGENEPGGRCVAVAVPSAGILAAISVSAPAARLPVERVKEVAYVVRGAATNVAAALSSSSLGMQAVALDD